METLDQFVKSVQICFVKSTTNIFQMFPLLTLNKYMPVGSLGQKKNWILNKYLSYL